MKLISRCRDGRWRSGWCNSAGRRAVHGCALLLGVFFTSHHALAAPGDIRSLEDDQGSTFFNRAGGFLADDAGNLLVSVQVSGGYEVQQIAPDGSRATVAFSGTRPVDLAFDSGGDLYATIGSSAARINTDGTTTEVATGLSAPSGIAFDFDDNMYVSGAVLYRIDSTDVSTVDDLGYDASVSAAAIDGHGIPGYLRDLFFDEVSGLLLVSGQQGGVWTYNTVTDQANQLTTSIYTNPGSSSPVGGSIGVTTDAVGNVFYAGFDGHVVYRVDANEVANPNRVLSNVTLVAGMEGVATSTGDGGPATSATLVFPEWIAVVGTDVYVGDRVSSAPVSAIRVIEGVAEQPASTNIIVTNNSDFGAGSLRQAVADIAAGGTIGFQDPLAGGQTINLTAAIGIEKDLTISADQAVTLDGNGSIRHLDISGNVTATIENLMFRNGSAANEGGSIRIDSNNTVTLNATVFDNNISSFFAGAIFVASGSNLSINHSSFVGNTAADQGGVIYNSGGTVSIHNTSLVGNESTGDHGGAIFNKGTMTVSGSTLHDNQAEFGGGAIFNDRDSTLTITDSTVSSNRSNFGGGGITNDFATLTLKNSTLLNNVSAVSPRGGLFNYDAMLSVTDTIIANANSSVDCSFLGGQSGVSFSSSIDTDGSCPGALQQTLAQISLGPLADNGCALPISSLAGSACVQTFALLPGSTAIDAGDPDSCTFSDQRGESRGVMCDIGAYEAIRMDSDGDGVFDDEDAFPNNPDESSDADMDGVGDNSDNCPSVVNGDQADANGDGFGDACVNPDSNVDPDDFGANPQVDAGVTMGSGAQFGDNANIGANATIRPNVTAGNNVSIGENTTVRRDAVLGDDVAIGVDAVVAARAIVGDNVTVGDGAVVRRGATVGSGVDIGQGVIVAAGATVGSDVNIGEGSTVRRGAIVGNNVQIGPNVVIAAGVVIGDNVSIGTACLVSQSGSDPACVIVRRGGVIEGQNSIGVNVVLRRNVTVPVGFCVANDTTVRANSTVETACSQ